MITKIKRLGTGSVAAIGLSILAAATMVVLGSVFGNWIVGVAAVPGWLTFALIILLRSELRSRDRRDRVLAVKQLRATEDVKESSQAIRQEVRSSAAPRPNDTPRELLAATSVATSRFAYLAAKVDEISRMAQDSHADNAALVQNDTPSTVQLPTAQDWSEAPMGPRRLDQLSRAVEDISNTVHRLESSELSGSLRRRISTDTMAAAALYSLDSTMVKLPLSEGWSIDIEGLLTVVRFVRGLDPGSTIVELGSGISTVWIAHTLRTAGLTCNFVSLEHDAAFAKVTLNRLRDMNLEDFVDLRVSPLVSTKVGGKAFKWYSHWDDIESIDLLLVDGPPKYVGARSRFPAFPLLAGQLACGAHVLLDDCGREDESAIAEEWAESSQSGTTLRLNGFEGRLAVLELVQTIPGDDANGAE